MENSALGTTDQVQQLTTVTISALVLAVEIPMFCLISP